ncbi:unnamed protein product [Adineta steineri]|uniref:mRNA-capping enzyme n=2 Tax=Adineta steineri TaxID=433720 RepID=A0A815J2M6_9BILA|nr:unnamed protein product [Adineta steineri]
MAKPILFSSLTTKHDAEDIIPKWLGCPRKSQIIDGKFVTFKMPIVDQNKDTVPIHQQWLCKMLIQNIKDDNKKLGLVIDLNDTTPYYTIETEYTKKYIRYENIPCHGIDKAIDLFASARSPGIFSQIYLDKLIQKYGDESIKSRRAPPLPTWCSTGLTKSTTNKRPRDDTNSEEDRKRTRHEIYTKSCPKFAVKLANVIPIDSKSTLDRIRSKCQGMCKWDRQSFPGSQPVSMDSNNYRMILQTPYKVSWKADGTRYMMLIEDKNNIYMIDRNNDVFQIKYLWFPEVPDCTNHLENTLLDGEFVIDKVDNKEIYRYLVYDIVCYNNENVSQQPFTKRMEKYQNIIKVRNEAVIKGHIDDRSKPFSIRAKDFWDLSAVSELLGDKFQSQLLHESDGLIFQPPYISGRSWRILKWKTDNTIDFQLIIANKRKSREKEALLYLNNMREPFSSMHYSSKLDQYHNKIIECSYQNKQWMFYRHRSDKTYANAKATADGVMNAIKHSISKDLLCSIINDDIAYANYLLELN